jgi:anaerobic selenocysteine-containing dehydrogenase
LGALAIQLSVFPAFSSVLPLPTYQELPETPYSDPELAKEYPLIFTTWESGAFYHSQHRQVARLRAIDPEPLLSIHPETAAKSE